MTASAPLALWQAILLGLIEGITEYLPVSSTGHLLVAQHLLGLDNTATAKQAADAYAIAIQFGAILAVVGLYRDRVWSMLQGLIGRNPDGKKLLRLILTAFFPAAVIGFLFDDLIEQYLLNLPAIGVAWIVGGIGLIGLERYRQNRPAHGLPLQHLTMSSAAIIGLSQCIAMWPGTSRSLVTIAGGLLIGLSLPAAVEFSFLLGGVTLTAASSYAALKSGKQIVALYGWAMPLIGVLAAFVSAVVAVRWLVAYLQRHNLSIFGYYRLIVGTGVLVWLALR